MKKSEFLKDVLHEINMLKTNATKTELERLDFDDFSPSRRDGCIYGQMTGNCNSKRAKELMDKSCIRGFDMQKKNRTNKLLDKVLTFSEVKNLIDGKYESKGWEHYRETIITFQP